MTLHGLYAITDSALLEGRLLPAVEAALKGGAAIVQYRDKSTDHPRREAEARALLALCRDYGRPLLINDDVNLALRVGAHGVHLGRSDGSLQKARAALPAGALIGATCHDSLDIAAEAKGFGADYLAFGAFYPSSTKPGAAPAQTHTLTEAAHRFHLPVVAIGGITADNAAPLIQAGASLVAVISDLWNAPDIEARARTYCRLFASTP